MIRVERERGTEHWIVTSRRRGVRVVLHRGSEAECRDHAQAEAEDAAWRASNRD